MTNTISCIIIEDDIIAGKSLEKLCEKNEFLDLKGIYLNGQDALNFLKENPIQLLFLDIELPDMKGWELLEALSYIPMVIATSSNKEYAYDAFQYKVADFIQKPIQYTALESSLVKVKEQYANRKKLQDKEEVYVKANGKLVRIVLDKIFYIENLADYVKIFTQDGNHVIYCTMKYLESRLPDTKFMKIHRSFIINLNRIQYIEDSDVCIEGKLIPIARSQKADLLEHLNLL